MSATIKSIEAESLAGRLGWLPGDIIVSVNGHRIADEIDFRFHAADEELAVTVRRDGILKRYELNSKSQ